MRPVSFERHRLPLTSTAWPYDFVQAQTHDGHKIRLMAPIGDFTQWCLAVGVARRINNLGVLEITAGIILASGDREHICSDNDPRLTAKNLRQKLKNVGTKKHLFR